MADKRDIQCEFGTASYDGSAKIGIAVNREHMTVDQAVYCFDQRKVSVKVIVQREDDIDGQLTFIDTSLTLEFLAETKGFTVNCKSIGTSLVVLDDKINLDQLGDFAKQRGRIELEVLTD